MFSKEAFSDSHFSHFFMEAPSLWPSSLRYR